MNNKKNNLYKLLLAVVAITALTLATAVVAQDQSNDEVPYHEIPAYPEKYTACTVAGRVLDGLGYRYYWATAGLREEDLAFKPSPDARSTAETLDHIYNLSKTILNVPQGVPNGRSTDQPKLTFKQKRKATLENIRTASVLMKGSQEKEVTKFQIVFQRGEDRIGFPLWNLLNGQIADALYHTGQIVSFRRTSGNPINPKVSVFTGKTRE